MREPIVEVAVGRRPRLLERPVEGDLDRLRRLRDRVRARRVVPVERLAPVVVVGLVGREGDAVEKRAVARVVADDEQDLVLRAVVGSHEPGDVGARRPGARGGHGRRDRPLRAVVQAGRARSRRAGSLGHARQAGEDRVEPAARPSVVPAAVDVDVVRRACRRPDLQVDRAATVDALRRRIALDAAAGDRWRAAELPARRPRVAVLKDDRVPGRAGPRGGRALRDKRVTRLEAERDRADDVEVRRPVGCRGVGKRRRRNAAGRGDLGGHSRGARAPVDGVVVGSAHRLPGKPDAAVERDPGQALWRRRRGRARRGTGEKRRDRDSDEERADHAITTWLPSSRCFWCQSSVAATPSASFTFVSKPRSSRALVGSATRCRTSWYLPGIVS